MNDEQNPNIPNINIPNSGIPNIPNTTTPTPAFSGLNQTPTPQTKTPAFEAPPQMPPAQKKSELLPMLLSIIVLLGLVGGGVFAYYKFVAPSASPIEILKASFQASLNVKSFSFSSTAVGKTESKINNSFYNRQSVSSTFTTTSSGSVDVNSWSAPLFDIKVGMNAEVKTASSTASLLFGLNAMYTEKNIYLNLKDFNASLTSSDPKDMSSQMFIGMANGFVSVLKDKWIKIDTNKYVGGSSGFNYPSEENITAIRDYITGMSYVTASSYAGNETINGVPTYHLKVTMKHGQALLDLIERIIPTKQTISQREKDEFLKTAGQKMDIDVWVGQSDSLVYKIKYSPITIEDAQVGGKSTVSQEMVFSNYNKPVTITVPKDTVTIEQMMQSLFGAPEKK